MVPESFRKEEEEIMPMPFHCIECDKPILQALRGLCDDCDETIRAEFIDLDGVMVVGNDNEEEEEE